MKSLFKSIFKSNPDIEFLKRAQQSIEEGITNSGGGKLIKLKYIVIPLTVAIILVVYNFAIALPNGQVGGVLVDKKGRPFPNEVDVFFATIIDEASGKIEINTTWQSPLDDSGAFLIKDVPPGKYVLLLFSKKMGVFRFVLKGDKPFSFEMSQDSGIDLGKIDASKVRQIGGYK